MGSLLPPEINECIMHLLRTDVASLKVCGLVCLSWFHASRPKLFHTLTLSSSNPMKFFNQYQSTYLPPCTSYCTTLKLVRADWLFFMNGESFREFVLHFADTLVNLSIIETTCPSFSHLMMAMMRLYSLRSLSLDNFHLAQITETRRDLIDSTNSIESLCIRNGHIQRFLGIVNSSNAFQNVTKLELNDMKEKDLPHGGQFLLQHVGLQELSLSFSESAKICAFHTNQHNPESAQADTKNALNVRYVRRFGVPRSPYLGCLAEIRVVRIRMFMDSRCVEQNTAVVWAPMILGSIATSTLRHVILTVYLELTGMVDQYGVDWTFLDDAFNYKDYRGLESITFENLGPADRLSLEDLLSARLPKSARRGLLRIC